MSALTSPTLAVRIVVVVGALVVATLVEVVTGAAVPGRMPVFALAATFVLVLGAKQLARVIQRPLTPDELATEHLAPGSPRAGAADVTEGRDA